MSDLISRDKALDVARKVLEKYGFNYGNTVRDELIDGLERIETAYDVEADEQGLLIKLPCKVGDTVYQLDEDCEDGIYETKVLSFMFDKDGLAMRTVSTFPMVSDFGKTVFLTRAEAEQALAEKGV